jgi:hypothetical protein
MKLLYRFDCPRANFFTFFLFEPRGAVRLALGAAFLRAARFSFFRSSLSFVLVVSATRNLFQSSNFQLFPLSRDSTLRITGIAAP